jgi:hypothetical protein
MFLQTEAALDAITANLNLFGADQLTRLEQAKVKSLRLPSKMAYFQGGTTFHRVAVTCPLANQLSHLQQLLAALVWANRVSNGQKTILYLVGEGFSPVLGHLVQLFGARVEVRLAYYTPKLNKPFIIAGKDGRVPLPEYSHPLPQDLTDWERRFNPVEKSWFQSAISYFKSIRQVEINCLDNWVSVKFKGLEVVRIGKRENRLRIALITRYPRETLGCIGNREEKEGWFNPEGQLNSAFTTAFEERIRQLSVDCELFSRVCSDKQRLEHMISSKPRDLGLEERLFHQLDVSKKGLTSLEIEHLGKSVDGDLVTAVVHPQKDLSGLGQCLEQLIWSKLQLSVINRMYFPEDFLTEPQAWLICPQGKIHPEIEVVKSMLWPEERLKLLCINDDWQEKGIIPIRIC